MAEPIWLNLSEVELEEYVQDVARAHLLSDGQSHRLLWRLRSRRRDARKPDLNPEEQEELAAVMAGLTVERKVVGTGLTQKTFIKQNYEGKAAKLLKPRRRDIRKIRRKTARRPFSWRVARDVRSELDDALWASGCLEHKAGYWIVPNAEMEPHAGVWWYSQEICRRLENAELHCSKGEAEYTALHAFVAGELFAELRIRLAHNSYFEKQRQITEAQRTAPLARRKQSDEDRREAVRRFLIAGDKPLNAAENAAQLLGVSLTTIRRAFPGSRLPHSPGDF